MSNHVVTVPAKFYWDHVDRDCLPGTVVKSNKSKVTVELDDEALADLRSDAEYYSIKDQFERELHGLCSSAQATVFALDAAGAK